MKNVIMPRQQLDLFVPQRSISPRVKRVEKEIRHLLSDILQRKDIPPIFDTNNNLMPFPGIITVTGVKISADLRECKVFVMPLANKMIDAVLPYFELACPIIRKIFAQKSKMRFVPNFTFEIDSSFATAERIEQLLKESAPSTEISSIGENGGGE
ncbi:MAG: 30S ribosome-binding factor RbfA [Holosporales bacterium]|jgi:ribosome-binding factor A|nr:30S ribosome-binding factor RbfA [Holosporales bacterium]